ncbi:MAG TPA: glycoside hydrolase family 3 N-terminal domain-containing protein [Gaiellaceae bacterium]|nr:glycoside hydrolase family 3 N-terminal domain-containing protein [Gaiellaceae bacterium]
MTRGRLLLALLSLAVLGSLLVPEITASAREQVARPTAAQLIGQKLVVSMDGTWPSKSLLARARRGRIGGVLIHGYNFSSAERLTAIAARLQQAAAAGGRPRLLIAVDQEGGPVKTVSWVPPTLSPAQMGALGSSEKARRQGRKTGAGLGSLGINTNFAPVADVPVSSSSFMYRQGRTWSFSAKRTAHLSNAFAAGLADQHTLATMKHFPGLGFATRNTDLYVVRIGATKSRLASGLKPYRQAVAGGVPLVMLSNAVYDAYDRHHAAGWSRPIAYKLLRRGLGFRGVTITDSLDGAAHARGIATDPLAIKAARAGTDLLLLTGSEAASRSVYSSLRDALSAGHLSESRLRASYRRITALKSSL